MKNTLVTDCAMLHAEKTVTCKKTISWEAFFKTEIEYVWIEFYLLSDASQTINNLNNYRYHNKPFISDSAGYFDITALIQSYHFFPRGVFIISWSDPIIHTNGREKNLKRDDILKNTLVTNSPMLKKQ